MDSLSPISLDVAFPNYVVDTHPTGKWFYAFVVAYAGVSFILIGVLVSWGRHGEKDSLLPGQEKQQPNTYDAENEPLPVVEPVVKVENDTAPSETPSSTKPESSSSSRAQDGVEQDTDQNKSKASEDGRNMNDGAKSLRKQVSKSRIGMVLRELDRVADNRYPDHDPAFISRISSQAMGSGISTVSANSRILAENLSNVPSATITSQIRSSESVASGQQRYPTRIWDVSGRRWKNRRPIGRVDVIQNAITQEALSALSGRSRSLVGSGGGSKNFRARESLVPDVNVSSSKFSKGMSDVASSVLEEQSKDGRTLVFSSRSSSGRTRKQFRRRSHAGSISLASERSHMASIIDDITPNDAADANDPGLGNVFVSIDAARTMSGFGVKLGCLSSPVETLLTLAEPETEIRRVIRLAAPLTLGAISEPLFRLITAVFISNYLGTESMIAFVLVVLFVRLTSEQLSGAIIDSLSSFVQAVLYTPGGDGAFLAGQYVQHGVVLQVVLGVPTLAAWALTMDKVVYWLVQSDEIASIAQGYTRVVVLNYLAQAVGRTCTVVFHICGYEQFESIIDFSASALTMVAVCGIVCLVDGVNLPLLGYVQVLTGVAACMAKVAYPVLRGWVRPFQKGMLQTVALCQTPAAFCHIALAAVPLLVGSFLEFGEWELLTLFLRHLGPAEVATLAILSSIWEVLEAATEGMGEAAAIRVAYLLAIGHPEQARVLSYKVMYFSGIQALLVSSALLLGGKYLAVLFTSDPTLQYMTNSAMALIAMGNATMCFAQISWSLIGAQGRFRLATLVIFITRWLVTMPIALICIFVFYMDLNSIGGSIVVGYATASCALGYFVLRSDWGRLSKLMQEINAAHDGGVALDDLEDFDLDDDDDDSIY